MLKPVCDDLWSHETHVRLPGGLLMPSRATIVRLAGGGLVVHSPLAIDDAVADEIKAIGEVRFLVAPNCLHWMFLRAAKERYPDARVLGAPGLKKKLGTLYFDPLPEAGHIDGLGADLSVQQIQGAPFMNEHVFFHEPSRSLILTDLIFNMRHCKGFMMNLVLRAVGAYEKTAQSRIWRLVVNDRVAVARGVSKILAWDFDRLIVAHGEIVSGEAREIARRALAWMGSGPPLLGTSPAR